MRIQRPCDIQLAEARRALVGPLSRLRAACVRGRGGGLVTLNLLAIRAILAIAELRIAIKAVHLKPPGI